VSEQPWQTHNKHCPNRRTVVSYPGHACSECRAIEVAVAEGQRDILTVVADVMNDCEQQLLDGGSVSVVLGDGFTRIRRAIKGVSDGAAR